MMRKNYVFIAQSLDGFIADKNGGIDWLNMVPNPENDDCGYNDFIKQVDAIIMGRSTFEKVLSFGIDWPYNIPVFVMSNTLKETPQDYLGKVEIISGTLSEILKLVNDKGYNKLYIDGGQVIQSFLKEDLIDEMIITTIPILLGDGIPLFTNFLEAKEFRHIKTKVFLKQLVQSSYKRVRD